MGGYGFFQLSLQVSGVGVNNTPHAPLRLHFLFVLWLPKGTTRTWWVWGMVAASQAGQAADLMRTVSPSMLGWLIGHQMSQTSESLNISPLSSVHSVTICTINKSQLPNLCKFPNPIFPINRVKGKEYFKMLVNSCSWKSHSFRWVVFAESQLYRKFDESILSFQCNCRG